MRTTIVLCLAIFCFPFAHAAQIHQSKIKSTITSSGEVSSSVSDQTMLPKLVPVNKTASASSYDASNKIEVDPAGDYYSLAPLIQDFEYAYFMTDTGQATSHQYDETWKTLGDNQYGTSGGELLAIETTKDFGDGELQIAVQVTAVDSNNNEEPWVDARFFGSGFNAWRLDVGTSLGGNNQIAPDSSFEVIASGVTLYDGAGESLGTFEIDDTSNANGVSGVALIDLDGGSDIAGHDLATLVMFWNIKVVLPAPPVQVNASDGSYTDKIAVTWSSVSSATAYNVYYSASLESAQSLLGQYTGTSVDATGMSPGDVWYFWVYSVNANGESATGTYDTGYTQSVILEPADLAITILDAEDGTYSSGDELVVNNKIENLGGTASDDFRMTFYASVDTTITSSDHNFGYVDLSSLGASENYHYNTTMQPIPSSMPDGQYYIGAILSISDSNNNNNSKYDTTPISVDSSLSFNVTSGQSGAWYDPSHNGEGYFLQVLSPTLAVVFWFSYDKDGNQFWMTGVGDIQGSKIIFSELSSPYGGKFGPNFDPADVEYPVWGTLEFDFSSCNTARADYSGPPEFGSGTLNLTRLTSLWGLDCQGNDLRPQSTGIGFLSGGFSGSWYDLSHNGEGFVVEVINETTAVVIWFTYDTEGNPAWMLGSGLIDGASILVSEFQTTSGGVFGPAFNPDNVVYKPWGPAAYTYGSCGGDSSAGNMRYVPPPEFGVDSSQFLYRLVSIHGLQCNFLTDTYDVKSNMNVAENIFLDGDVNDPNVPEVSNDLDAEAAQQLVPPAKAAGFVTAVPTGNEGDRFANETDEWDVYILAIKKGEAISLNVSDWDARDQGKNDLDLYLVNVNDPETTVDSSLGVNQTEWVTAPADGNYWVYVNANSGTSNYLLRSGQSIPQSESKLTASVEMQTGELIAALRPQNNLASIGNSGDYKSQIEKTEKRNALTRIAESGNDAILYSVDTTRIDHLVPHPLTLIGRGSITPEDWQVIKTVKALSASQDYRWAGPNYIQHQMAIPNDPGFEAQWHYPLIRLPQAWDITTGSADVVVAVIDTGVYEHPDLASNVNYDLGYDFISSTFVSEDGDGLDPDARDPGQSFPSFSDYVSHGTHVAGTVGALGNNGSGVSGVNWDVTIMPVRVLGPSGGTCWYTQEGMKWAGQLANVSGKLPARKADVINMSLGGSAPCPGDQEVINRLVAKGIVVIAAAGNESTSIPSYPASLPNVISVSATTLSDDFATYSNFGSTVDVAAPGGDNDVDLNSDSYPDGVLSTAMVVEKGTSVRTNEYIFLPGTSMASPHIAGVAALMKSVYPSMGSNEFFTAISSGKITIDLAQNGLSIKDPKFGYGRIDAQKAVNWAVEQSQGSPAEAFLTTSISAANFGSNQQSIDFVISKGGEGDLSVAGGGDSEDWMEVFVISTDSDGLGTYRIDVDRAGFIDGSYSGWIRIDGSDGSIVWISITMQVGEKVAGEAGYLYALLLDSWTFGNVKQWNGLAISGNYSMNLDSNPPGTYYLMVGSDIDKDYTICDPGELCQIYPLNSQASKIVVSEGDVQLGNFTMGFPDDENSGSVSSASFGAEPESQDNDIVDIMSKIGTKGVSINKQ